MTNRISFYDKVTRLVDEGKAADVLYLDFRKAFALSPTTFPWRSWLPTVCMGARSAGETLTGCLGPKSCGQWRVG